MCKNTKTALYNEQFCFFIEIYTISYNNPKYSFFYFLFFFIYFTFIVTPTIVFQKRVVLRQFSIYVYFAITIKSRAVTQTCWNISSTTNILHINIKSNFKEWSENFAAR